MKPCGDLLRLMCATPESEPPLQRYGDKTVRPAPHLACIRGRPYIRAAGRIVLTSPSRTSKTSRRSSTCSRMKSRSLSWFVRRRKSTLRLHRHALGRSVAPAADNLRGLRISRQMTLPHQPRGNPRAADLVFLPELALAARRRSRPPVRAAAPGSRPEPCGSESSPGRSLHNPQPRELPSCPTRKPAPVAGEYRLGSRDGKDCCPSRRSPVACCCSRRREADCRACLRLPWQPRRSEPENSAVPWPRP